MTFLLELKVSCFRFEIELFDCPWWILNIAFTNVEKAIEGASTLQLCFHQRDKESLFFLTESQQNDDVSIGQVRLDVLFPFSEIHFHKSKIKWTESEFRSIFQGSLVAWRWQVFVERKPKEECRNEALQQSNSSCAFPSEIWEHPVRNNGPRVLVTFWIPKTTQWNWTG